MLKTRIKKREGREAAINVSFSSMIIGGFIKSILSDTQFEHHLFFSSDIERVESFSKI